LGPVSLVNRQQIEWCLERIKGVLDEIVENQAVII